MIIIGGTYREVCKFPYRSRMMGSGLRAGCLLSGIEKELQLFSAVDDLSSTSAKATAGSFPFSIEWIPRSSPITFNYFASLFPPILEGYDAVADKIHVTDAQNALVFGMVETDATINADSIVYDPQQPDLPLSTDKNRFKCARLAIVANKAEVISLGGSGDYKKASCNVLSASGAEAVVTKLGARGAMITTRKYQEEIGPRPTSFTMPIGSGDAFSAGFAWAWSTQNADPVEAAEIGSAAASIYVSTETLPLDIDVLHKARADKEKLEAKEVQVYLAGPFFTISEMWLVEQLYSEIANLGAKVFSPFHHVGAGGLEVAQKDLKGLKSCDSVFALLDHLDSGTIFEIGWAIKAGIPVVGFSSTPHPEAFKMLCGSGVEWHDDLSTAVYRSIWRGMGASALNE